MTRLRLFGPLLVSAALLAACGGSSGSQAGNVTDQVLRVMYINAWEGDITVGYTGTSAEDRVIPTCTAEGVEYPLAAPFTITVDGEVVVDSEVDYPGGTLALPNGGESDLMVQVDIDKDGVASYDEIRPGRGISRPSTSSFCPTLPG